jgi:outer membrane cobalamin receptor
MPCHASGSGRFRLTSFFAILVTLAVAASAFAQTLAGHVVDPDGRPVANAEVLVLHGGTIVTTTHTSNDGRFGPLELAPAPYDLLVVVPGLHAAPRHLTLDKDRPTDVEIPLAISAIQESVVVSAAQPTTLSRVTDSVTVVSRAELEIKQTDTIADALRVVPGFGVVVSGTPGGVTSIFPRGGESNYTLVLVDGIEQNAFGGGYDAAHLGAADVDRVEIVHGPQSALFGGGAIGGVVQVVTRQGGPMRGDASFEGGGYGYEHATASTSGASGAWSWGGAIEKLRTDGDTRVFPSIGRPVSNDDYDRVDGSGNLAWSDSPGRRVRVNVRAGKDERGAPGPYGSDPAHLYPGLDTLSRGTDHSDEVGVSATFGSAQPLRHTLQATWAKLDSSFTYQTFPASFNNTKRVTGKYQLDYVSKAFTTAAGWDILGERADSTFITDAAFQPTPVKRSVSGLFAEIRPALGERGSISIGARVERIERNVVAATFSDPDIVWSTNPKVSGAWFVVQPAHGWSTKVRAEAGTGIRPPDAFEIAFADNPHLQPERSRSIDAGVEETLAGLVALDATWFDNRYDDLIFTAGSSLAGTSRYRTNNVGNASSHGLELGVRWRGVRGFGARTALTWMHTEILAIDDFPDVASKPYYSVGDPLVRRPAFQGLAELFWNYRASSAFLTVGGRGSMSDLEPNFAATTVTNPGYATVAFGGSYRLGGHVEIFGRVTNALDRQYEEVYGFPALGRTASIGVRVAASR